MARIRNIETHIGKRFGSLVVIKRNTKYCKNNTLWDCICDCGEMRTMFYSNLSRAKKCTCNFQRDEHILNQIFASTKNSAIKRKIEFDKNLTKEILLELLEKQNYLCALSGIKLQIGRYHQNIETTASIDRIDSSVGYTINNIQWVHKDINKLKTDFGQVEFLKYCNIVAQYQQTKVLSSK